MSDYILSRTPIKAWAEDDRPREKLLNKGRAYLSDAELIAILIGSGNRDESAVELSRRILLELGNDLNRLATLSISELMRFRGIGEAKAITIAAALELGRRRDSRAQSDLLKISGSMDAWRMIKADIADLPHEEFWLVLLNRANVVMKKMQISRGGVSATVVDPKIIFRKALEGAASSVILAHNHPSGETKPSEQDIRLTRKIREGAALLEIALLDHIIVGANSYYSFADEGLL
ncbi:MAG: DNA repair protein RadC [Bacteroidia bacterium]